MIIIEQSFTAFCIVLSIGLAVSISVAVFIFMLRKMEDL